MVRSDRGRRVARDADHEEADRLTPTCGRARWRAALIDHEALLQLLQYRVVADLDPEHHAPQADS
jgi:hypothetical protein